MPNYDNNNTYFLSISLGKPTVNAQNRGEGSVVRTTYESPRADHADNNIVWVGVPDAGKIISVTFSISGTPQLDVNNEIFYAAPGHSLELDEVGSDYSAAPVAVFIGGDSKIPGFSSRITPEDAATTKKSGEDDRVFNVGFGTNSQGGDRWNNDGGISQSAGYSLDGVVFATGRELTDTTKYFKEETGPNSPDIENYELTLDSNSEDKDAEKPFGNGGYEVAKESVIMIRSSYGTHAQQNASTEQWFAWNSGSGGVGAPFWSAHEADIAGSSTVGIVETPAGSVSASNPGSYAPKQWKGAWVALDDYDEDDIVSSGLYKYRANADGTAGSTTPSDAAGPTGEAVSDGGMYWACLDGSSGRVFPGGDAVKGYRTAGHRFYAPKKTDGSSFVYVYPMEAGQISGTTTDVGHEMGIVIVIDRTGF